MGRQVSDLYTIYVSHISKILFIARIYEELSKCNKKKMNSPIKMGKKYEWHFTKENIRMAKKTSQTLVIRER